MRRILMIAVILLFGVLSVSQAQEQPIILLIDGDLWSMSSPSAEPFRETYWGYNEDISLSPDGRYVAYGSYPDWLVERDEAGTEYINYDQHPPTNIWLMEIATRTFTRIATQDEPALDDERWDRFIRRTTPRWSPDSRQLAWLQLGGDGDGLNLVVYDLETNIMTIGSDNLYGVNGDAGMMGITNGLSWGETLAFDAFSYSFPEPYTGDFGHILTVLDTDEISAYHVNEIVSRESDVRVSLWRWVEFEGQWLIALKYTYGWQLWDYETDTYFALESEPTLQIQSGQGLRLYYDDSEPAWTIIAPDGTISRLPDNSYSFALSPDGMSLAYMRVIRTEDGDTYRVFELWQDGNITSLIDMQIEGYRNVVIWAPMVWRAVGQLTEIADPTPITTVTPSGG